MGEERRYRRWVHAGDLRVFRVVAAETDLQITAELDLTDDALAAARSARADIVGVIEGSPEFAAAESPLEVGEDAPGIVRRMTEAARAAGVGPMAAVAGAVAEHVGRALLKRSAEVLVENGGDIFMASARERTVALYAGSSPLSGRVAVKIAPGKTPCGVCTSSGTVGHSKSYGCADAAVVIAPDTALADAVATATGNRVKSASDLEAAVEWAAGIEGVTGCLVVLGDKLAAAGDVELSRL